MGDPPDAVARRFGEPHVAIGSSGDAIRGPLPLVTAYSVILPAVVIRPIRLLPGEPEIPVWASRNACGDAVGQRVFGDAARRRDTADLAHVRFCEPQVAVRSGGDEKRAAVGGGDRELGDAAGRRDYPIL